MKKFYQALREHFGVDSTRSPLYQRADWIAMGLTFLFAFVGYLITLAPDLTLEDCGELAVGSFYAAVPHPPGYPVWTIYTWLFTVLVPIANVAYRVAVSSAFASALSCGIIAMLISRGASLMIAAMPETKELNKKVENLICTVCGIVGGLLFGYNGFVWSQSVIVEVYTLSVLSLVVVMVFMMRWMYAPEQRQYLYLAMFVFGICFTNHQTLLVAAMGLEVMIILIRPTLGREMLMGNSVIFLYVLVGAVRGQYANLSPEKAIFPVFIAVGILSILGYISLLFVQKYKLREWGHNMVAMVSSAFAWLMGSAFYLFMPLSSMTNPPMNWGYARTVKGFFHALTRGQYESAKPTSDLLAFFDQIRFYVSGAMEEFTFVILILALIPFVLLFFKKMETKYRTRFFWISIGYGILFLLGLLNSLQQRTSGPLPADAILYAKESGTYIGFVAGWVITMLVSVPFVYFKEVSGKFSRSWLTGSTSVFFCLAILLLILFNPATDKQSRDLHKVFFTSSYVFFAIWIGYGLAMLLALLITQFQKYREVVIYGAAIASGLALYGLAINLSDSSNPLFILTAIFGLLITVGVVVILWFSKEKSPTTLLLAAILCIPAYTVMAHWWDNEQHGHLFGFWFGHDMFTPPFQDKEGKPLYPEIERDAILYGGTDPGRFCPTYMIFCESFIPPEKRRDPKFDRRDVYIITQNALADETYLDYIRAHYNRSKQKDPVFFQELLPARGIHWLTKGLDDYFIANGARVEARRRAEGVYPTKEIYIPSHFDWANACLEYDADRQARAKKGQLKPGEENGAKLGQTAVMAINGLLTKVIFDANPNTEFYIEESFALDWMYPYLTPYGIIMKINRNPLTKFTPEIVNRDHEFWGQYMDRLCGNWITYDTTIGEICDFARRTYIKGDFKGYTGDMKFLRDNDAQKAFSKLRSALTGLYWWRANYSTTPSEQQMLIREAEFAGKQAFALCPFSPEAMLKLINILVYQGRFDDAINITLTSLEFDPENRGMMDILAKVAAMKKQTVAGENASIVNQLANIYATNMDNSSNALMLAIALLEADRGAEAQDVLLRTLPTLKKANDEKPSDPETAIYLCEVYRMLSQNELAKQVIEKMVYSEDASLASVVAGAQAVLKMGDVASSEGILKKAAEMAPSNERIRYDLAAMQAMLGKAEESIENLNASIEINKAQLQTNTGASDLFDILAVDKRFDTVRSHPGFPKK